MGRNPRFLAAAAVAVAAAAALSGCRSSRDDPPPAAAKPPAEGLTFVRTDRGEDGLVHTTVIFDGVTEVRVDGAPLPAVPGYDSATGVVSVPGGGSSFEVTGFYANPPVFVLPANICPDPLVLYGGRRLVRGEDYDWDAEASRVTLLFKADLDADSYLVLWYSETRDMTLSNKADRPEYAPLVEEWRRSHESE